VKITLERLREIITEEVIKEELAPEIAAPAIAAMLQGTEAVDTSEIFGAVFDQMYGEGALDDEAERMASAADAEPEEQSFPTEYQPGGAYGDRPEIRLGRRRPVNEIIQQELALVLVEELHAKFLAENKTREDYELEQKLASYVNMLNDFVEKAVTFKGTFDTHNIMQDIVNLIYGKLPYRNAANISNVDRRKVEQLGSLIRTLAEPYNVAKSQLRRRDVERHGTDPKPFKMPGHMGPDAGKEAARNYRDAQIATMFEDVEIEIIDD